MEHKLEEPDFHQIHFNIPMPIYKALKKILPDHGGITSLFKNFAIRFIADFANSSNLKESPFDSATKASIDKIKSPGISGTDDKEEHF